LGFDVPDLSIFDGNAGRTEDTGELKRSEKTTLQMADTAEVRTAEVNTPERNLQKSTQSKDSMINLLICTL